MKKILYFIIASMIVSSNVFAGNKSDSAPVIWYDSNTKHLNTICNVDYYVENDTLFVNQEFKNIGFLYSDNKTGKLCLLQKSLIFKHNQKKNGYWYVVFSNSCIKKPTNNCHLTGIVLRTCQTRDSRNTTNVSSDAYLYNITNEISHSKGSQTLNSNLQKIYKYVR